MILAHYLTTQSNKKDGVNLITLCELLFTRGRYKAE